MIAFHGSGPRFGFPNPSPHEGRPAICREYPGKTNCGYYDFLKFERTAQNDPDWVSTTNHD